MVMPSQPLFVAADETISAQGGGRVVAAPVAPTPELSEVPKRRTFNAKYKLRILEETDRAADTRSISEAVWKIGWRGIPLCGGL